MLNTHPRHGVRTSGTALGARGSKNRIFGHREANFSDVESNCEGGCMLYDHRQGTLGKGGLHRWGIENALDSRIITRAVAEILKGHKYMGVVVILQPF